MEAPRKDAWAEHARMSHALLVYIHASTVDTNIVYKFVCIVYVEWGTMVLLTTIYIPLTDAFPLHHRHRWLIGSEHLALGQLWFQQVRQFWFQVA